MTSCPASASARAAARPMTPAPMTTASTSSTRTLALLVRSGWADLDAGVVEAGAFREVGPHIGRDESGDRLPGAARLEPRALLARDDPRRDGGGQIQRQDHLTPLLPPPDLHAPGDGSA